MAEIIKKCRRIHVKLIFLLIFIFFIFLIVHAGGANQRQTESAQGRMSVTDAAKTLFSLPTTISPFTWFNKLKSLFIKPPNLDFREEGGGGGGEGSEGAAEKVKDAVVKSLDKSKSTVEDSAKTAAELAEEAVGKTVNKLSGKGEQHHTADHEPEL